MDYKVVPFTAQITQKDTTATVADQLQTLINQYSSQGWEYVRLENVETNVAPENGCFGIGAKPGFTTSFKMVVFKK
jgi:ABC-type cobalamin transport system ATPase subunit